VSTLERPVNSLMRLRVAAARPRALAALLGACASIALLLPAQAGAIVTTISGVTVGVAPRISSSYPKERSPTSYSNSSGNPVLHGEGVYAIYWDPDDEYWSEWQAQIDGYLHNAGAASGSLSGVFAVDSQYDDKSNKPASYAQVFKGAYTYAQAYPPSACEDPEPFAPKDQIPREHGGTPTAVCLTSSEVANALETAIAQYHLPKGLGNVYYMLTPPGVTVCLDGGKVAGHCSDYAEGSEESYEHSFCSYHSAVNPGGPPEGSNGTIVYAVIPWSAGGYGDNALLEAADRRPGWECQDGGINPAGKNGGYELEVGAGLEGPHEQEPNQQKCPSTAGTCDYGLADLIINQIGIQQQDMVTNPLLNAWQDMHHYENSDECRFLFGPAQGGVTANEETMAGTLYDQTLSDNNYYINDSFSLAAELVPYPGVPCIHNVNLAPKFTAPNAVNSGEVVGFDGMESDVALDAGIGYSGSGVPQATYATYTWNFGDGTPEVSGYAPGAPVCETPWLSPCAASEFHTYQYGGTYDVTLTVRDVGGNSASTTQPVTVNGPLRGGGSSSGAAGSSGSGSGSGSGGAGSSVSAPVAAAMIVRQSLRTALRKGLAVSYSVNEQVAGHFEVLVSRAVARRLGIGGSPATGLPAGSPAEIVIAKAILVTTKGGRNAVHIQFSKHTAARLAHAHSVAFMLRLVVRNAATASPATTTVLSSATLRR
jgi:PKD domain